MNCRLQCVLRRGRRSVRARVLDVSEGGLCLLSPVRLVPRQVVQIVIDVPRTGPVQVEAVTWHVRQVKSGRAHREAWSIGMMISKADPGFAALLPDGATSDFEASAELSEKLRTMAAKGRDAQPADPDPTLEEDTLSSEELRDLDTELLSREEIEVLCARSQAPSDGKLHMFRVRVKATDGPRTRALTLGALCAEEAAELARSELGGAWQVLEVARA